MGAPISFYDLPAELREMVYIHALIKTQGIAIPLHGTCLKAQADIPLGLFKASNLTRREALLVFFGKNTFNLDCTDMDRNGVAQHLRKIGTVNMRMIKSYTFTYRSRVRSQDRKNADPWKETSLNIQILPRTPFYSISGSHLGVADVRDATVAYLIQDMFSHRNVRSLATNDILDIAIFVRDFSKACDESEGDI